MAVSIFLLQACLGRRSKPLIQLPRDSSRAISGSGRLYYLAADRLGPVIIVGRWATYATTVLIGQKWKLRNGNLFSRIAKKSVAEVPAAVSAYVIVMVVVQNAQLGSFV